MTPREWQRIRKIADSAEGRLRDEIIAAIQKVATPQIERKILAAIKKGDRDRAMQIAIDAWQKATKSVQNRLAKEILTIAEQSFGVAAETLRLAASFDLTNPAAVEFARSRASAFAQTLDSDTQRALRQVISSSFLEGIPPAATARLLRQSIGLAPKDVTAIANYRAMLERLAGRESLDGLSKTVTAKLKRSDMRLFSRKGLDDLRIDRMTEAYRNRLVRERATLLVRTETIAAANNGQQMLWQQAIKDGLLGNRDFRRKWIVTPDDRLCPTCKGLENQVRGMDEPFVSTYDGKSALMPPMHWNCRCAMGLVFAVRVKERTIVPTRSKVPAAARRSK